MEKLFWTLVYVGFFVGVGELVTRFLRKRRMKKSEETIKAIAAASEKGSEES